MGYSQEGSIKRFWPDDTDTEFYVPHGTDLSTLLQRIAEKWPLARMADIQIDAEHIHTDCLTYDLHDPGDYTNFIVVRRMK